MVKKDGKLLRYEVQRVLFTKPYLFLSLVTVVYSIYVLQAKTLFGEYGTAPFSQWSYLVYLLTLMPVLCTTVLVYIAKTTDSSERLVQNITRSTPTPAGQQLMVKFLAIAISFLVNLLIVVAAAYIFYEIKLKLFAPLNLLLCTLIIAAPQFLICAGAGFWAARVRPGAVYVLAALLFFLSAVQIALPMGLDFFGNSILSIAENTAPVQGVIAFSVPTAYAVSRIAVTCIGAALIVTACSKKQRA